MTELHHKHIQIIKVEMTTLEEAINAAKCAIDDLDEVVLIDRSQFASRKRGKIAVVSKSMDVHTGPLRDVDGNAESIFWREKYEKLRAEHSAGAEEIENQLAITIEREDKLDKYAKLLEKKIEKLLDSAPQASSNDLIDKLDAMRKKLAFYERMTSLTVKMDSDDQFICTTKNNVKKVSSRFKIVLKEGEPNIDFAPIANPNLLPEYLREEIECESAMLPVIMGDVLQSLYDDK